MTDRELLEAAARAAGIDLSPLGTRWDDSTAEMVPWNPLHNDGDALRLAVRLNLSADFFDDFIRVGYTPNDNEADQVDEPTEPDPYAATRRAIVRAAGALDAQKGAA